MMEEIIVGINFRIDYLLPEWTNEEQKAAISKIIEAAAKNCITLLDRDPGSLRTIP